MAGKSKTSSPATTAVAATKVISPNKGGGVSNGATTTNSNAGSTSVTSGSSGIIRKISFIVGFVMVPYTIGYFVSTRENYYYDGIIRFYDQHIVPTLYKAIAGWGIFDNEIEWDPPSRQQKTKKNNNNKQRKTKQQKEDSTTITTTSTTTIPTTNTDGNPLGIDPLATNKCYERFEKLLHRVSGTNNSNNNNLLDNINFVIHRNGESQPCGAITNLSTIIRKVIVDFYGPNEDCEDVLFEAKYEFESLLTEFIHAAVRDTCYSVEKDRTKQEGFYGFCDMGESKTPILMDYNRLIPIEGENGNEYLPCHFHNKNGIRVTTLSKLVNVIQQEQKITKSSTTEANEYTVNVDGEVDPISNNQNDKNKNVTEFHLYAVPAGRVFIHAPSYVGEIIELPHVVGGVTNEPVYMKVISLEPKVFEIMNFFSMKESDDILQRTLEETRDSHRIKRSSTGASGYTVFDKRTSETGFDTDSQTSLIIRRRCFEVLGFDEYIESHADGLQILRYNLTKAYIPHMDWIDGNDQLEHDYESSKKGGNRYATILLYFTDLGENDGGETVFTEAWPADVAVENRKDYNTALRELRELPQSKVLTPGSWEEEMVAKCRSRLAIRPQAAKAVLFYSQLPNGMPDPKSLHGGCPVLGGTKYAANLWVWNTPRDGYPANPKNPNYKGERKEESYPGRITGIFKNSGTNPEFEHAKLYYVDQYWGPLGFGDPDISVNTYPSHVWNVKVNDVTKQTFTITTSEPATQTFVV